MYNSFCIDNDLLPKFTNIKLHDEGAKEDEFVLCFRRDLIKRLIGKLSKEVSELRYQFG
jgi:Zn-dependent oligopeptidase